ncbi:MAG: CvpA family protein [Wenzhouxiangellaceae bacterium]|nr:CvpA family protein [Wenzhouxiangellaceae bacterium]
MNAADLAILGILAVSVIVSLLRGFIKEVFSILVWAAAIFAAFQVSGPFAEALEPMIELPSARMIIAFSAVFLLVLIIGGLVGYLIGQMVEKTGLSSTDRLFGAVFGLARGVLIVVVAVMLARLTPFIQDPWWQQSRLLPSFEQLAIQAGRYLPEPMRRVMEQADEDGLQSPAMLDLDQISEL